MAGARRDAEAGERGEQLDADDVRDRVVAARLEDRWKAC